MQTILALAVLEKIDSAAIVESKGIRNVLFMIQALIGGGWETL